MSPATSWLCGIGSRAATVNGFMMPPAAMTGAFSTPLPQSPLTYEGVIVKVRWCVRVRLFFEPSRDFVSEHVFALGRIPPARIPPASP
jgi:hypothetical protein